MIYRKPTPILKSKTFSMDIADECWKQQELRVNEVKKITSGKGGIMAMIDDGVGSNTELAHIKIERWTYLDETVPTSGDHSTLGVTAVVGRNLGIFPELSILSKQVLHPNSGVGRSKEICKAIKYAKDNNIQTINLSLGSNDPDPNIEEALKDYCSNGINTATISSGNDGPKSYTSDYPANYAKTIDGVYSIAATEIDDKGNIKVAVFSSRGVITVGAPGAALKSMNRNNQIDYIFGTSFSSPIVCATIAAARILINRPLYQSEIDDIFSSTSKKIDNKETIGYGSINVLEFLKSVQNLKEYKPKSKCKFWCKAKKILGIK